MVQGDLVAGGKIEIKDSVLNRTQIDISGTKDDGRFIVHTDRNVEITVGIKDSVIRRSDIGGLGKNVEVYRKALQAAFGDGRIDDNVMAMIEMLQRRIGITPGEHLSALEELNVLEKQDVKQYEHVLSTMLTGETMQISKDGEVENLRRQNGIPRIVHQALVTRLRSR